MSLPNKSSGNRHPAYQAWLSLRFRCNNPVGKNSCYAGISYDSKWESFESFWEDMGSTWASGLTIDRIDSTKNYCKSNCRWADKYVQANNKSNNRRLTYMGITKNLHQWADEVGLKRTTLLMRLTYGWSVEKALTTPVRRNS